MNLVHWLYLLLAITTLFLAIVLITGKRGKRKWHLISVCILAVFLIATIVLAREAGTIFTFPQDRHDIHMPLARLATLLLFGPLITGILYWYGKVPRVAHLIPVVLFVLSVLAAFATGAWMMAGAVPK